MLQMLRNGIAYFSPENPRRLLSAIESGDGQQVRKLLTDFEYFDEQGVLTKALKITLKNNRADIARMIIEKGFKDTLDLRSVRLTPAQAITLMRALKYNDSLKKLLLGFTRLEDQAAIALAAALPTMTALTTLELDNNQIANQGAKALAAALDRPSAINKLMINGNFFGDEGLKAISAMLVKNNSLTEVCCCNLPVTQDGIQSFIAVLKTNQTLKKLNLSMTAISFQQVQEFYEALRMNRSLIELTLTMRTARKEIRLDLDHIKKMMLLKEFLDHLINTVKLQPDLSPLQLRNHCQDQLRGTPLQALIEQAPFFFIEIIADLFDIVPEYTNFDEILANTIIPIITKDDGQPVLVNENHFEQCIPQQHLNALVQSGIGWRLFLDENKQIIEHVSTYEGREPGCLPAMGRGFHYAMTTRDEPLTFAHIINTHQLCAKKVQNLEITQEELAAMPHRLIADGSTRVPLDQVNMSVAGLHEWINHPDHGRDFRVMGNQLIPLLAGQLLIDRVNALLTQYHIDMGNAKDKTQMLLLIVELIARLERIHPFHDANCRTLCVIILNRELIKHGFPFAMLRDPNRFDGFSKKELMKDVIHGFVNFEQALLSQIKYKPLDENDLQLVAQIQQLLEPLKMPEQVMRADRPKCKADVASAAAVDDSEIPAKRLRTQAIIHSKRKKHDDNNDGPAKRLRSVKGVLATSESETSARGMVKARRSRLLA